jgi:molybdenum cofactor sulfurtransferase
MNNPHSEQEDSKSLLLIEESIELILSIFDTSTRYYSLIFTLNTSHACQLLSTLFPFSSQSEYAYMIDSHNSLIGIRQQVKLKQGSFSVIDYPLHIYHQQTDDNWAFRCAGRSLSSSIDMESNSSYYSLFATPAENNFNGLRPPLENLLKPFIDSREKQLNHFPIPVHRPPSETCHWLTLVDCAKYLSTKSFSLATYPVDFVVLSFYKIFGYPTGLGALIIRNESLKFLNQNTYFGGGSVQYISPYDDSHVEYKSGINGFIYGTIPFTTILSLSYGFQLITSRLSYQSISLHTQCLIDYCRNEMLKLKYSNGQILCLFYDNKNEILKKNGYSYGAILNFNLYNYDGQFLSCRLIQRIANDHQIILRVGTFCTPGASQAYLGKYPQLFVREKKIILIYILGSSKSFENNHQCHRGLFCGSNIDSEDVIDSGYQPLGSIRLSLGWMSRYEDIQSWIHFLQQVILQGIGRASDRLALPISNGYHEEIKLILTNIYIYPIKSCSSISVKEWPLTSLSLLYDREWMIIDQNLNPLTLKRLPLLSQIKPMINLEQNQLILNAKNHSSFSIDINHGLLFDYFTKFFFIFYLFFF